MHQGICFLCNDFGALTYEHVPPKKTFNQQTRFTKIPLLDFLKEEDSIDPKFKGKIKQGGIGYYVLCNKCNNFLGATYVNDYIKYTNSFVSFARKEHLNTFEFTMHSFKVLYVIKQILSMFLTINDASFSINNRDLAAFILDPKSNKLPRRFRLFTYLNTEGNLRYIPKIAVGSLKNNTLVIGSEITFPPLGFVLTIDFKGQLSYLQEITSFSECESQSFVDFHFKCYRLPTYSPVFLDYRDKENLVKDFNVLL